MQELLKGPEGCALTPDTQAAHVDHVAGLGGTYTWKQGTEVSNSTQLGSGMGRMEAE